MSDGTMSDGAPTTVRPTRTDRRTGNPWVTGVVSFVIGVVFGAIATVGHRHQLRFGEVVLPWGIVAALVGVAALLLGMRIIFGRLAATVAAVGVVGIVALFTLPGLGGSVLVPGTVIGTIWAIAPALIAVIVVAWPSSAVLRRPVRRDDSPPPADA